MWLIGRLRLVRLEAALLVLLACVPRPILAGPEDSASNDREVSSITVRKPELHTLPIQVDVNLVLLNVTVTDPYDRTVTGLEPSNFQVFDEKVEQQIISFSTEDAPIAVGLVFDSSGSMADKIQQSREAVLQFFKTSNPLDEFMLINFNERPGLVSGFTSKFENLQDRLLLVKGTGKTALLDAIYLGLSEMKKASTNRKALLVISDGGDKQQPLHTEGHQASCERS
jgi:Ca-activated chloride channel family protein